MSGREALERPRITSISFRRYKAFADFSISLNEFNVLVGPGRTAGETLHFVLKDGFDFCEWEVRESRAADAEAARRAVVPDGEAQLRARQLIESGHARRRSRKTA